MPTKVALTTETRYQLLLQISHKVRNTLDVDETLNLILDTLETVLDCDAVGIFILNRPSIYQVQQPTEGVIAGIARRGFDPIPVEEDRMLMLGEGISGYVIRTGETVIVSDVSQDPRYVVGRQQTRSEIGVPIIQDEQIIGALNVESDRFNAFDADDLDVLLFFADAAAISIEKAMLHRSLLQKQQLDEQLKIASAIQDRLIPDRAPNLPGYEIGGIYLPAFAIGGDYFDYISLADGRLGISLADVSGHGVPAALVMTAFRALLRTEVKNGNDSAGVCNRLNTLLPDFTGYDDFVTAVYGVLNPQDAVFSYTNCGHHPVLCVRVDGGIEQHKVGGPALSIYDRAQFEIGQIGLRKGDLLILYTDGLVELADSDGNEFGRKRLAETLVKLRTSAVNEILEGTIQAAKAFANAESIFDDIALLVVRRSD
ncbi:MAG: PP2C family protein-serine/threonine phosphatase [Candidatus Promineifilaceae bacterium]|jgi:sigma-B regulation protein RsbU (phosphoserine phosphatase)